MIGKKTEVDDDGVYYAPETKKRPSCLNSENRSYDLQRY